ncbi:anti-sigma factor domain-containing protein [Curtobacterium sp. PhB115]|uniref:anti-sigma factor n=1 Tax=Curtobacterium sp. PhB115 TaxID=2485173 RepID=UPI000F4D0F08|nr:anti-sigma factor [Curtobacterium sp. PhB115]ROP72237.1 anti-sigma-K factor rskA [Curtobacterium sp. PhB115]
MTERHDDPALLTGSYALDALSDDERALIEDALRTSPELQAEADSLRETALQLAYATAPVEPPAALKASLLAQIASTPQAAPIVDTTVDSTPVTSAPADSATVGSAPAGSAPAGSAPADSAPVLEARPEPARHVASIADGSTAGGRATSEARRRWFQRPAVMLTAAAAVAAVFFGGLGVGSVFDPNDSGPGTTQASSGLDRIYAASDFQRSTTKVEGGGTATVVWSNDLGKSAVILDGVAQAPKGKTYELWYIGSEDEGGSITAAGLMDGVADGVHSAVLKGSLSDGATIGMTVEPAGGSEQPTTTPIMAVPTTTA